MAEYDIFRKEEFSRQFRIFWLDKFFCRSYTVNISDTIGFVLIITDRLSPKGLDIIYRLFAVAQVCFALGLKVNDRPIGYFSGKFAMTSV